VHRSVCITRPICADQAADQYDQPKADADRQEPTDSVEKLASKISTRLMREKLTATIAFCQTARANLYRIELSRPS